MIYYIENKALRAELKEETLELPQDLREKINANFEKMKNTGANIWNGEVMCVSKVSITDGQVDITCKKTDYAHYLYGERIGCPKEYECKNLSAGCLLETSDGYYVVGELDDTTSYPGMLQVTGGGVDKKDITDGHIDILQTIKRETKEVMNIDLDDSSLVKESGICYIYLSNEDEQPGVELFVKAKINLTASQMQEYFESYYKYLQENGLELEFKTLHYFSKDHLVEDLDKLNNPRRYYLKPLMQFDAQRDKKDHEDMEL